MTPIEKDCILHRIKKLEQMQEEIIRDLDNPIFSIRLVLQSYRRQAVKFRIRLMEKLKWLKLFLLSRN